MNKNQLLNLNEQLFVYHPKHGQCRIMSVGSTADNRITNVMLAPNDNPSEWVKVTDYHSIKISKQIKANEFAVMVKVYKSMVSFDDLSKVHGVAYAKYFLQCLDRPTPAAVFLRDSKTWNQRIFEWADIYAKSFEVI